MAFKVKTYEVTLGAVSDLAMATKVVVTVEAPHREAAARSALGIMAGSSRWDVIEVSG